MSRTGSDVCGVHVLVTGGCGYIGSHTVVRLLEAGAEVVIFDNLCNSKAAVIDRIERIAGKGPDLVIGDLRDKRAVQELFAYHHIDAVIHFAGLKAVGESEEKPLLYYDNNVTGSVVLFEEMARAGVRRLIFSSSATVYGNPECVRYREDMPVAPINVYGRTKLMVEDILRDVQKTHPRWSVALLRYFNPVGAHSSGLIGEDPNGVPNNLMPYIAQVAVGKREKLRVFGGDYPTRDGTGLRDYIHVDDLARGHIAALAALWAEPKVLTVNLGTGKPYSVLEMVAAFEKASGKAISWEVVARRAGDLPEYYADPGLAETLLGWRAAHGIDRMCEDAWRWQQKNPDGYR